MAAKYIYDLDGCESPFTIKVEVTIKLKLFKSKMSESQLRGDVLQRRQTGQIKINKRFDYHDYSRL